MVTIIIVGVNEWERYTLPFIASIIKHEPYVNIVCVDNGSQPAYPETEGVQMVRSDKVLSYAAGINLGINACKSSWYITANNDIILTQPFTHRLAALPARALYGFAEYHGIVADGVHYLSGWLLLISSHVLATVGNFDENYKPMYFEDADYSYRCTKAEIRLYVLTVTNGDFITSKMSDTASEEHTCRSTWMRGIKIADISRINME